MARRLRYAWVFAVVLALIGWFRPAVAESVKDMPQPTNYVNDYAGVLNDSTKDDLNALLKSLDTQAKAQVFVAVIHKIDDGSSPPEFANELLAKWKPGSKGSDRGVVLLISVEDRKYQFEIGYGLEGILPDGKVGDIGREMVPDFKDGNYDGAVRTGVNDVAQVIAADANVTLDVQPVHTYHRERVQQKSGSGGIIGFLVLLFVLFLLFRGGRGGRGGGPGGFLTGMILGNMMGGSRGGWGGGGGGWGGGDSGGGGFGGGDGGSSGGGGAGGGW